MKAKKLLSVLLVMIFAVSVFAFSANAAQYEYTVEDLDEAPIASYGSPTPMNEDGEMDKIWEKTSETELKAMGKSIRVGLEGGIKLLWDADNVYALIRISGDNVVVDGETTHNTKSFEDELNFMMSLPWATADPEADDMYQRDEFNSNDISFQARRLPENSERLIKEISWGNPTIDNNTKSILEQIKQNVQFYETDDEKGTFYVQYAIPWIDKSIVKDGLVIGIDFDYGDWLGAAEAVDGVFEEGSVTGKPHLYFSENYAEGMDDPAANAPVILSEVPAGMDVDVYAVKQAIEALPKADDLTLEDETEVNAARELYDSLTEQQKAELSDVYALLTAAEKKLPN